MTLSQERLDDLWDFSDAAGSEIRLRAAADETVSAAASSRRADSPTTRAELETQVARALGLQGRFAEGDAVLDEVAAGDAASAPVVRVRVALERGRLRNSGGEADAAVRLFREAAAAAASEGLQFLRVDALHMLAIADARHCAEWTAEALAVLDGVVDPRTLRWRVSLHSNAGWSHVDAGRLDDALAEFERAKAAALRWGTPQQVEWADEALAEARASLPR